MTCYFVVFAYQISESDNVRKEIAQFFDFDDVEKWIIKQTDFFKIFDPCFTDFFVYEGSLTNI